MTGKEFLSIYCQEKDGEEIYNFLKRLLDESLSWTDSRLFIIDWLNSDMRGDTDADSD